MCRNSKKLNNQQNRGSALVIAIFVLVVMSLLGATLVRMLSSNAQSIVYEVMGTRAFQAAQIGVQWQLQQIFPINTKVAQACPNSIAPPVLSSIEGLDNCIIVFPECTTLPVDLTTYYTIKSTGQCKVGEVITSRTVEVQARSY